MYKLILYQVYTKSRKIVDSIFLFIKIKDILSELYHFEISFYVLNNMYLGVLSDIK